MVSFISGKVCYGFVFMIGIPWAGSGVQSACNCA